MNGKGSHRRGSDPESTRRYAEGWERIFGSKKGKMRKKGKIAKTRLKPYPHWVCSPCGSPVSRRSGAWVATWHTGKCDVCGQTLMVTEARDFGYPDFPGHITREEDTQRWAKRNLSPESRALFDFLRGPKYRENR